MSDGIVDLSARREIKELEDDARKKLMGLEPGDLVNIILEEGAVYERCHSTLGGWERGDSMTGKPGAELVGFVNKIVKEQYLHLSSGWDSIHTKPVGYVFYVDGTSVYELKKKISA